MMIRFTSTVGLYAMMIGAALAQPAFAQTASNQTASNQAGAAPDAKPADGVADIVVTAQRRTESSQKAAIAIDVITNAALKNAGIVTADTLNAAAPALIVTRAGGANTSFYVRGVGNFTSNAYADPSIAFNLDGVYLGRPTSTTGAFYDLDRVEVLKGPQGTLYGRNATGGAINVIPTKPKLGVNGGYANIGYGSFNTVDGEAALNLAVGADTALRFSGKVINGNGYNDDGTNDEVGQAFRAQVLHRFSDDLTIRVAGDYSHNGGMGPGASFNGVYSYAPGAPAAAQAIPAYVYANAPSGLGPYSGLLTPAAKAYFSTFVIGGPFINPAPILSPYLNNTYWGVNAEVTANTGIGTVTFIPAYRDAKIDNRFNGPAFEAGIVAEHDKQLSGELRLDGKSVGPVDWLVGIFAFSEKINVPHYTFSQYVVNVYQALTTGTDSYAGFGRVVWHATDSLRLTGGGRYSVDTKHFNGVGDTLIEICTAPGAFGPGTGCFGGPSVPAVANLAAFNTLGLTGPSFPGGPGVVIPDGPPVSFGTHGNLLLDQRLVVNSQSTFRRFTYRLGAEFDVAPHSLLYATYETGYHSGGFSFSASHPTFAPEYITAMTLGSKNRFLDNRLQLNVEAFRWKYTNQQVSHFGFEADGTTNLFTENIGASTIQGVDVDVQLRPMPNTVLTGSVQVLDNKYDNFSFILPAGGTNLPPVVGCPYVTAATTYTVNCTGQSGYNSPKLSLNGGIEQTFPMADYRLVVNLDARYRSNAIDGFERLAQQNTGAHTVVDFGARLIAPGDRWTISAYAHNLFNVAVPVATQYSGSTGGDVSTIYAAPRNYGVRAGVKF